MKNKFGFTLAEGATQVTLLPTVARFGFTLAEVLITLGIIGVVAAMTIPALLNNYYEKQTVTRLKSTYSILTNAIRSAEEENGEISALDAKYNEEGATKLANHLKPYLKIAIDCGTLDIKGHCVITKNYKELNGKNRLAYYNDSRFYKFVLLNGVHVILSGNEHNLDINKMLIYVDTNGLAGPNQWGKDFFRFEYAEGYGLVPTGHPYKGIFSYKTNCNNTKSTGVGCAYYIINFNDMKYLHKK